MKKLSIGILIVVATATRAQTTSQNQVHHIATSLNHLTVLAFGETVTTVAIGDLDSFEVERSGDKVLIKPLQQGVSTNLFVWTATREMSYELDPAGPVGTMDVLINAAPSSPAKSSVRASVEPSDEEIHRIASLVMIQALTGAEVITHDGARRSPGRIEVDLDQIYRAKDRLYIRYSVTDLTKTPFRVVSPDVYAPEPTRQPVSLVSLRDHQLTQKTFSQFKTKQGLELPVLQNSTTVQDLAPGEKTTGVISVEISLGNRPQLYQLDFGVDQSGPVRVEAVL